jgi:hypothetical protein
MHSVWRKAFKCVNTAGNEIVFTAESSQRVNIRRACLLRNGGMHEFFIELIAKFLFVNCWIRLLCWVRGAQFLFVGK